MRSSLENLQKNAIFKYLLVVLAVIGLIVAVVLAQQQQFFRSKADFTYKGPTYPGSCGDNPVNPPDGMSWVADCSSTCQQFTADTNSCPQNYALSGWFEPKTTAWCFGFDNGATSRCMQLQSRERIVGRVFKDFAPLTGYSITSSQGETAAWGTSYLRTPDGQRGDADGSLFFLNTNYITNSYSPRTPDESTAKMTVTLKNPGEGNTCTWYFDPDPHNHLDGTSGSGCSATINIGIGKESPFYQNSLSFHLVPSPNVTVGGTIKDPQGVALSNIDVVVRKDSTGAIRFLKTNSQGGFAVNDFIIYGEKYSVLVNGFLAKTTKVGHSWNYCLNDVQGTDPWADTPPNSDQYECQKAGSAIDCSGNPNDRQGISKACSFIVDKSAIITPKFTPTPPTGSTLGTPTPSYSCVVGALKGGAQCVSIAGFNQWIREFTGQSTTKNADLSPKCQGDNQISIADFQVWIQAYISGANRCSAQPSASPTPTQSLENGDVLSCTNDSQCISVRADNCGCSAGGKATSINKEHLDQWEKDHPVAICSQVLSTDPTCINTIPKCVSNKCKLVSGTSS